MSTLNVDLKKFDMSSIADDSTVIIIGKRNTGKSFLTMDFMYYHQDLPVGTVISPTENYNNFYKDIVPKIFIHQEPTPELLKNIIKRQDSAVRSHRKNKDTDPRAFLIMDDCMAYATAWVRDKMTKIIFMNGRHLKVLTLITLQDSLGITPELRTNTDYVFILREPRVNMRKRLYEHYTGGMFKSFEIFCKVLDSCTENYECLVIDNKTRSNKLEDQVYWYKAESHESFKVGAPEIWDFCKENCPDEDDTGDNEEDENNLRYYNPKKGPNLLVNKINPSKPRPKVPYNSARRSRPNNSEIRHSVPHHQYKDRERSQRINY